MNLRLEPGFRVGAAYFGLGVTTVAVYFLIPHGMWQNAWYDSVGATAIVAILAGIRLNRPATAVPWLLFAWGTAMFVSGDIVSGLGNFSSTASEALYLCGYPMIAAGLVILIVRAGGHHRLAAIDEAGIATFAFAIFQWVFIMRPALEGGGSELERAVNVAYTGADVVLIAGFAGFFVSTAWRKPSYVILVLGVTALLLGDEIYSLTASMYYDGSPLDSAWLMSYVLFGTAALHPSMRSLDESRRGPGLRVSNWRIALLTGALLTPSTILLVQWARGKPLEVPAIFSATAVLLGLVVWRLVGILRALERIRVRERQVRADAERATQLLAEQNKALIEADRVKDEFVSLISHDLRTPLTSVIGYSELALDDSVEALDPERRRYLEVVMRNAERLLHLVDDLLFIARLQAGRGLDLDVTPLDLAASAREAVVEALPRAQQKGVELRYAGDETAEAAADSGRIFQLLDNLVANAIKFTPAGGSVEVAAARNGSVVFLEVRDTGIGLAPGDERRLFERFFRTERATMAQIPGTGLGLFIARAITEAHNGRISAEPREGGGTVFRVELPVEAAELVA